MLSASVILLTILPYALGCAQHENHIAPFHKRQELNTTNNERTPTDWTYDASYDWGRINPEYNLCQTGTQQSPIALNLNQGLSQQHTPLFTVYDMNTTGEFFNWGYGPAMTYYHPEGDFSGLPTLEVDGEPLYLTGWHIHAPADHLVGGIRSRAEIHFVHYDGNGTERAVVAIRLDPGKDDSPFFAELPAPIGFNDTSAIQNMNNNPLQAIREVNNFDEFWTYRGSLTSPPCKEGIQWFLARNILFTSVTQMQQILGASTFSARAEQEVWLHEVNV